MPQSAEQRLQRAEAALEKQIAIIQILTELKRPKLLEIAERLLVTLELNVEVARQTLRVRRRIQAISQGESAW
jgi:hypothetical protein